MNRKETCITSCGVILSFDRQISLTVLVVFVVYILVNLHMVKQLPQPHQSTSEKLANVLHEYNSHMNEAMLWEHINAIDDTILSYAQRSTLNSIKDALRPPHPKVNKVEKPWKPCRRIKDYDPMVDNLPRLFEYSFQNATNLSHAEMVDLASKNRRAKGEELSYHHNSTNLTTFGTYYKYDRNHGAACLVHYISLKYDPTCGDAEEAPRRRLLIVSVQRSGTHYIWEMLNRLGLEVHHEGVGMDGAVSWFYSVNAFANFRRRKVGAFVGHHLINGARKLSVHRFEHIFHQLRHPLKVISTIDRACPSWDRYWDWISCIKGFEIITRDMTSLV